MGLWKVEGLQRFISMEIEYVEEEREEEKENVAPTMFSEPSPMSCMDGASVMEHTDLGFFSTEKHVITVHINKRGTENKAGEKREERRTKVKLTPSITRCRFTQHSARPLRCAPNGSNQRRSHTRYSAVHARERPPRPNQRRPLFQSDGYERSFYFDYADTDSVDC